MADVSFEEETYQAPQTLSMRKGGFTGVVIRMGLAKNEREASALLLWVAIAGCLLAAGLFVWMYMSQPQGLDESDIERIIRLQQQ